MPEKDLITDDFRSSKSMLLPDDRWSIFQLFDPETNSFRAYTLDDHYQVIEGLSLQQDAPVCIHTQWDTARNLWLYSWHVWRFLETSQLCAYSTLEMALRLRFTKDEHCSTNNFSGLSKLMKKAVDEGYLVDHEIEHCRRLSITRNEPLDPVNNSQDYCRILIESFPKLRNSYAHGSESCGTPPHLTFSICRDLINQLWSTTSND